MDFVLLNVGEGMDRSSLTGPCVSPQVAHLSHLLQSDLSAAVSNQEGAQAQTDHRHLQLRGLRPGVTGRLMNRRFSSVKLDRLPPPPCVGATGEL